MRFMLPVLLVTLAAHSFQVTSNKPFVQVEVNGSAPQWFILDSGNNGHSIIAKECAERLGIARGAEEKVHLGAGAGTQTGVAQGTRAVHLEALGDTMTVAEPTIFTMEHVDGIEGRQVNGLLGADFFFRHVIRIDYAKSKITLLDTSWTPPSGAVVLPLHLDTGWPIVAATITSPNGSSYACHLIVDTGMRGVVTLFRPFSEKHDLYASSASLHDQVTGAGAGGISRGDIGRLKTLQLGTRTFAEPVATFSRDTTGVFSLDGPDGIMGGELLRRHRVTFDYPHRRMVLEPYHRGSAPFDYDMSGLFLYGEGSDYSRIRIKAVNPNTPASEAGLREGDEILAIDGRRTPSLTLDEARILLRRPKTRKVEIRRAEQTMVVRLAARRLV